MCTSLIYLDAQNRPYLGRTLELTLELPYQLSAFPQALALHSGVSGFQALSWTTRYPFLAVTMPAMIPKPGTQFGPDDLKVVEGMNDAGLCFSVQSYPEAGGGLKPAADASQAALSAADLGAWVLGQFATVQEVKDALDKQNVVLEPVPILGGIEMPFHYGVHDAKGNSIVIEFHHGKRTVYDNLVGVMTNGPQFPWHLTNLGNYTYLSNVDQPAATFGSYEVKQPDAGSAKASLPSSDTAVDRFVRAAYYAKFAEKQTEPDLAVQMVAHIMNNFDRPRGATVSYTGHGGDGMHVEGFETAPVETEFTSWTSLSDLDRRIFFLRDSGGMNFARFDVAALKDEQNFRTASMAKLLPKPQDITATLTSSTKRPPAMP